MYTKQNKKKNGEDYIYVRQYIYIQSRINLKGCA